MSTGTDVVMKNAGTFMDLGDKAQYMDEFTRRVKSVVLIAELEITNMALFFSRPIPEDITAAELYTRLTELLEGIHNVRNKLKGEYLTVAANIGFMSKLSSLQESAEEAKVLVRRRIPHRWTASSTIGMSRACCHESSPPSHSVVFL